MMYKKPLQNQLNSSKKPQLSLVSSGSNQPQQRQPSNFSKKNRDAPNNSWNNRYTTRTNVMGGHPGRGPGRPPGFQGNMHAPGVGAKSQPPRPQQAQPQNRQHPGRGVPKNSGPGQSNPYYQNQQRPPAAGTGVPPPRTPQQASRPPNNHASSSWQQKQHNQQHQHQQPKHPQQPPHPGGPSRPSSDPRHRPPYQHHHQPRPSHPGPTGQPNQGQGKPGQVRPQQQNPTANQGHRTSGPPFQGRGAPNIPKTQHHPGMKSNVPMHAGKQGHGFQHPSGPTSRNGPAGQQGPMGKRPPGYGQPSAGASGALNGLRMGPRPSGLQKIGGAMLQQHHSSQLRRNAPSSFNRNPSTASVAAEVTTLHPNRDSSTRSPSPPLQVPNTNEKSHGGCSIDEMRRQLDEMQKKYASLQQSFGEKENALKVVQEKLAQQEEEAFGLQASMLAIDAEANNRIKKVTESMESKLKFKEKDLAQAQNKISKLMNELESLRHNSQLAYGSQRSQGRQSRSPRATPTQAKRQCGPGGFATPGSSAHSTSEHASGGTPLATPSDSERQYSPIKSVRSKYHRKSAAAETELNTHKQQSPENKGRKRPRREDQQEDRAMVDGSSMSPGIPRPQSIEVEVQTDVLMTAEESEHQVVGSPHSEGKEDLLVRALIGDTSLHLLEVLGLYGKTVGNDQILGSSRWAETGVPGTPRFSQRFGTQGAGPSTPWSALSKSAHKERNSSVAWQKGSALAKEVWLTMEKLILGQESHISMALALLGLLESSNKMKLPDLISVLHILEILLLYSEDVRRSFIFHESVGQDDVHDQKRTSHFSGIDIDPSQRSCYVSNILSGTGSESCSASNNCLFDQSSSRLVNTLINILDANWKKHQIVESTFKVLAVFVADCPLHAFADLASLITKKILKKSMFLQSAPASVQSVVLEVVNRLVHQESSHRLLAEQDTRAFVGLLEQIIKLKRKDQPQLQLVEASNCLKAIRLLASLSEKEEPVGIKNLLAYSAESAVSDIMCDHGGHSLLPILILCLKRHLQNLERLKVQSIPAQPITKKLYQTSLAIVTEGYALLPLLSEFTAEPFTSILENSGTRLALQGLDFKLLNNLVDFELEGLSSSVHRIAEILDKEQRIFVAQQPSSNMDDIPPSEK